MKQGVLMRIGRLPRILRLISAVATAPLLAASCNNNGIPNPFKSIVVDRQVWINGTDGSPNAIAQTSDGGFVIAGARGTAWAVVTNGNGGFVWEYVDPINVLVKSQYQSEFKGVVPLANGDLLFCGSKTTPENVGHGFITILRSTGGLVEQRLLFPKDDSTYFGASFHECFPWDNGIVVIGGASKGEAGYPWVIKLDRDGVKEWEIVIPSLAGANVVRGSGATLVLETASAFDNVILTKINSNGDVVARSRAIKGYEFVRLRSIDPTNLVSFISYGVGNKATLYRLGEQLDDAEPPMDFEDPTFNAAQGFGYALADKSFVLFGNYHGGKAAVAYFRKGGGTNWIAPFPQIRNSKTFSDAIALSENKFVTVASENGGPEQRRHGLFLSWVTLK
jgi:hypothetical protein